MSGRRRHYAGDTYDLAHRKWDGQFTLGWEPTLLSKLSVACDDECRGAWAETLRRMKHMSRITVSSQMHCRWNLPAEAMLEQGWNAREARRPGGTCAETVQIK